MDEVLPYLFGGGFFLVAVTILGVMIFAVTRLRAQESLPTAPAPAPTVAQRGPWSWGTVVLLVGVVAALAALAVYQLVPPSSPLVIKVTAYEFGWKFDYYQTVEPGTPGAQTVRVPGRVPSPELTIRSLGVTTTDRLSLPKDVSVLFLATSLDVIHRFSAPEFLVRRDVVPGLVTPIWVEPRHTGRFKIESDYLCGAGDGVMLAAVDVVAPQAFDAWLAEAMPRALP